MKATDLRIGNYVFEEYGGIYEVININSEGFDYVDLRKPTFNAVGRYDINSVKGIELTEEILLKCPQIEKSDDYGDQKYFNLIGTKYFFCLDHDDFSFGIYNEKNNQSDITILNYFDLGISLHTFQNLIFALTNQELTINL